MATDEIIQWTVVVLTCQHKDSVYAFQRELDLRQQRGGLPAGALLLTVADPQARLGSGGATLNALLVAAEHLSARAGHTVVTADVLDDARILILHTGRDFPWDSCGRAFCWLPVGGTQQPVESPVCCLDMMLDYLSHQVCPGSPPGVWVCSTDMLLRLPSRPVMTWEGFSGVRVMALPGDVSYAANHGVYLCDTQGSVRDIIYRGSEERIRQAALPDGKVPMVSGPVFLCRGVSERLLQTHVTSPLDGCTYMGMDSGAPSLQISLFLDILLCLCSEVSEKHFISEERPGSTSPTGPQGAAVRSARAVLWRTLRGTPLTMEYIPDGTYDYMTMSGKEHICRLTKKGWQKETLSHIESRYGVSEDGRVINSVLEGTVTVSPGAVIQHCHLQGLLEVPSGTLVSGLKATSGSRLQQLLQRGDTILQGHRVQLGELKLTVYTVLGANDDLEAPCEESTFLNHSWTDLYQHTGIRPEELWASGSNGDGDTNRTPRSLFEARLFPVFQPRDGAVGLEGVSWLVSGGDGGGGDGSGGGVSSAPAALEWWRASWRLSLKEVLFLTDQEGELRWREELFFHAARRRATDTLRVHSDHSLLPSIRAAVLGGRHGELLTALDNVAAGSSDNLGVAARTLACIADVLGCMAGEGRGGLRSGPAANPAWASAFSLLEQRDLPAAIQALANQRSQWLNRPDLLVRAARHYEGAGQVLLRQAVMSAQEFVSIGEGRMPPMGQWQEVECPARLDLSGGWSDTPPIAFERGGAVVNVAVRVDGRRPIGAKARRVPEPRLLLVTSSGAVDCSVATETVCTSLQDLEDHCQPHAPGALLKAVCVCSGLVTFPSQQPLDQQLLQRWGGGLELHSWSLLPHGSGLGTSSILAGAVLAAVYRATGRSYDTDSLIHAVLHLEQTLTTGGGWQDQVGGLVGGVKLARSRAFLPLKVEVEPLDLSSHFLTALQQRLLLVYTGKTRLARNLLQDVVRSWYSRLPSIVSNTEQLVRNAEECALACTDGDLSKLGACLDRYWQQKKVMAPGCEPAAVRCMMGALRPLALGQSLAGAGGGGFLYLLTRDAHQEEAVRHVLSSTPGLGDFSVHSVELDMEGICVLHSATSSEDIQ
ncbi:L-fucose kinase [Engraulis encrasicolus]|uniref:L-fucose kinase n=1 Tax=Engraulis encrasicolus TaxID=184585 RepID=UPI002FD1BBF8